MYHELFDGQSQLPYHIFLIDAETEHIHAHTELEICFLLCGNADFAINQKKFSLYEHDFIIINPLALHQIQSCTKGCRVLFLQIDLFAFQKYITGLSDVTFKFSNVMNNRSHPLYQTLYRSLRNILNTAFEGNTVWRLTALQEVINILSLLLGYYQSAPDTKIHITHEEQDQLRMLSILEYLNQNWKKHLTLTSIAEAMGMSPSYFSRFFKKNMGTGFLSYLTDLRLKYSLGLLLNTDTPIVEIALECGFNDYKTYGRLFKKKYEESPQIYRKTHISQQPDLEAISTSQPTQILEQLALDPLESPSYKQLLITLKLDLNTNPYPIKYGSRTKKIQTAFTHTITIGSAAQLLRRKAQEHLLYAQNHIQLESVRFSDIFSENMLLYQEDSDGQPCFNWKNLDEIFDFLNQHLLSPFLVLDAMPEALSTLKHKIYTSHKENIPAGQTCIPKSTESFLTLIRAFANHYVHRYHNTGLMKNFRIQLWMLPESPKSTWNGTEEQFFELVEQTYFTLRKSAPDIQLGSPAVTGQDLSMLKRFLAYCEHKKIQFDFFCLNSYSFTSSLNTDYPAIYSFYEKDFPYSDGDRLLNQIVGDMTDLLAETGFSNPVVVTEWGLSPYIKDLSRDTSFMAAWITEHITHLSPDISEICYCMLTDLPTSSEYEFVGGQGLLTHSGIPKPSFYALQMLEYLGTQVLDAGDDYLFTKCDDSWRLLLYNYSYYSEEYLNGKQELLFEEDRYNIFEHSLNKVFQIQLNLTPGKYRLETVQIDREHYAPYDEWIKMGKPEQLSSFYHKYLIDKCCPGLHTETISTSRRLQLQQTVPIHGVTIITIRSAI